MYARHKPNHIHSYVVTHVPIISPHLNWWGTFGMMHRLAVTPLQYRFWELVSAAMKQQPPRDSADYAYIDRATNAMIKEFLWQNC